MKVIPPTPFPPKMTKLAILHWNGYLSPPTNNIRYQNMGRCPKPTFLLSNNPYAMDWTIVTQCNMKPVVNHTWNGLDLSGSSPRSCGKARWKFGVKQKSWTLPSFTGVGESYVAGLDLRDRVVYYRTQADKDIDHMNWNLWLGTCSSW
jgi:hypothetical protein